MTMITLDTAITDINKFDTKTKTYFESENIKTLGELLMSNPSVLFRSLSVDEKADIINQIHGMGFVFLCETGFIEQLKFHLFKKYNLTNFKPSTFSKAEKGALLDYKLYELLAFLPTNHGRNLNSFYLEAKYSSLTLQEALAQNMPDKKKCAFAYTKNLTTWYGYIRSLGFEFKDTKGYQKEMNELTKARDEAVKNDSYDLDINIQTINSFLRIHDKGRDLSDEDLNELVCVNNIFTIRDILCIDDEDYRKFPTELLVRIKVFLNAVGIPFIGDKDFAKIKNEAISGAKLRKEVEEVTARSKIEQRFNDLSKRAITLIGRRSVLEYDNNSLESVNNLLTLAIEKMENIERQAQIKGSKK